MSKMSWCFGCNSNEEAFDNEGCIDFGFGVNDESQDQQWDENDESYRPVLKDLLKDHRIDIGAAENLHLIYPNQGETYESLRNTLRERLNQVAEHFKQTCGCCEVEDE